MFENNQRLPLHIINAKHCIKNKKEVTFVNKSYFFSGADNVI